MVDEHPQMGDYFWHDCPRSERSFAILKIENVLAVFVLVDYLSLSD